MLKKNKLVGPFGFNTDVNVAAMAELKYGEHGKTYTDNMQHKAALETKRKVTNRQKNTRFLKLFERILAKF